MDKTISKKQARQLLRQSGLKMIDLADYLDIKPNSLSVRWKEQQLSTSNTLMVHGFVAIHDQQYQQLQRHRDNPALKALLDELDKNSQDKAEGMEESEGES